MNSSKSHSEFLTSFDFAGYDLKVLLRIPDTRKSPPWVALEKLLSITMMISECYCGNKIAYTNKSNQITTAIIDSKSIFERSQLTRKKSISRDRSGRSSDFGNRFFY